MKRCCVVFFVLKVSVCPLHLIVNIAYIFSKSCSERKFKAINYEIEFTNTNYKRIEFGNIRLQTWKTIKTSTAYSFCLKLCCMDVFKWVFVKTPVTISHHVVIPSTLVPFLHCFYILVGSMSLLLT